MNEVYLIKDENGRYGGRVRNFVPALPPNPPPNPYKVNVTMVGLRYDKP
jgi:hypothetical protein